MHIQTYSIKESREEKKNTFEFYLGVNALLEDEKRGDVQGSQGIRQWPINFCTPTNEITLFVDYN